MRARGGGEGVAPGVAETERMKLTCQRVTFSPTGNKIAEALIGDGPGLLSAAAQHAALPSLLLASCVGMGRVKQQTNVHTSDRPSIIRLHILKSLPRLIEHDCRKGWIESLATVTFADRAEPRTHVLKVSEACITCGVCQAGSAVHVFTSARQRLRF